MENKIIHTLSTGSYSGTREPGNVDRYDQDHSDISEEGTGRRIHYADFTTIDWIHDLAKDRIRVKRLHSIRGWYGKWVRVLDASQAWIVVSVIGICAGCSAAFIDIVSKWLDDVKFGYCKTNWFFQKKFCCIDIENDLCTNWSDWDQAVNIAGSSSFLAYIIRFLFYLFFAILFAACSSLLVKVYAPYAAGSGIPEVKTILSGFIIRKFLGIWTLIVKSIGLSLSVASGLALGKEGPLVHVSCCFGNIFPRLFPKYLRNEAKKREILSAAAAAGVSVAFGAPIGGVLFSLEEVSYYFGYKTLWRSFFCAMVAAVTLQIINPLRTHQLVLFQVTYDRPWHAFEIFWFVLIGILGGLFGALFIRLNLRLNKWRKSDQMRDWRFVEVLAVAGFSALVGFHNLFSRINMSELVSNLFRECEAEDSLDICDKEKYLSLSFSFIWVGILKAILMTITFGLQVPAGIFVPSMSVGACVGRVIGIIVQTIQEAYPHWSIFSSCPTDSVCITPGTYALLGAAAFLGGVTRMTVSLVIIMFELTGALTYVVPIIITVIVAKWVGDAFGKQSIYEGLIELNGYPFLETKDHHHIRTKIEDVMTKTDSLKTLSAKDDSLSEIESLLANTSYSGYPVVSKRENNLLIGFIGRSELEYATKLFSQQDGVSGSDKCYFAPKAKSMSDVDLVKIEADHEEAPLLDYQDFDYNSGTENEAIENIMLQPSESAENITSQSASLDSDRRRLIDFRLWIDMNPITLPPNMDLETSLILFRKLGLRYALVTKHGILCGLMTKKDILRHIQLYEENLSQSDEESST